MEYKVTRPNITFINCDGPHWDPMISSGKLNGIVMIYVNRGYLRNRPGCKDPAQVILDISSLHRPFGGDEIKWSTIVDIHNHNATVDINQEKDKMTMTLTFKTTTPNCGNLSVYSWSDLSIYCS